jgi:hypothetical protein
MQAGARALAAQIKSPPIEVVLAEAAVALIRHCRPPGAPEPGRPVSDVVPSAVLAFLRRRVRPTLPTHFNGSLRFMSLFCSKCCATSLHALPELSARQVCPAEAHAAAGPQMLHTWPPCSNHTTKIEPRVCDAGACAAGGA